MDKPTIKRVRADSPDAPMYASNAATSAFVYLAYDGERLVCWDVTAGAARRKYQRVRSREQRSAAVCRRDGGY